MFYLQCKCIKCLNWEIAPIKKKMLDKGKKECKSKWQKYETTKGAFRSELV